MSSQIKGKYFYTKEHPIQNLNYFKFKNYKYIIKKKNKNEDIKKETIFEKKIFFSNFHDLKPSNSKIENSIQKNEKYKYLNNSTQTDFIINSNLQKENEINDLLILKSESNSLFSQCSIRFEEEEEEELNQINLKNKIQLKEELNKKNNISSKINLFEYEYYEEEEEFIDILLTSNSENNEKESEIFLKKFNERIPIKNTNIEEINILNNNKNINFNLDLDL